MMLLCSTTPVHVVTMLCLGRDHRLRPRQPTPVSILESGLRDETLWIAVATGGCSAGMVAIIIISHFSHKRAGFGRTY